MEILRRFIFGDVFDTGVLDDRIRELITVTVLACLQTLPQLKAHTAAALNVGVQGPALDGFVNRWFTVRRREKRH